MIKRFNKIAALLVAATTVASLGTSVNAAERLTTKEGTIENAIAFDGGKYIYDGYMTDDDESGLYFHDSKDNFLEEDDDYDFVDGSIKYGTKYAIVENDGDNYVVDLSTGKIIDDETIEDKKENLEYKLKSTFNKVDRYEKLTSPVELTQILEGQFGEVWYSYKVNGTDTISVTGESTTTPAEAAKMEATIEAGNFGTEIKIAGQVFNGTSSSYDQDTLATAIESATFTGFDVTVEKIGADVKVTLVKTGDDAATAQKDAFGEFANATTSFTAGKEAVTTPGETSKEAIECFGFVNENGKYIDASVLANITVANGSKTTKVAEFNDKKDGVTLTLENLTAIAQDSKNIYALAEVNVEIEGEGSSKKTYLQRISKSQGNKKDDAYLPSKVESFEVNGNYFLDGDNDDLSDAAELINGDNEFRVVNDTLYVTRTTSDNVEVSTIKLKKNKVTLEKDSSTKYDLYVALLDEQDDQDMQAEDSYSIDTEGNTWVLNKGKIYQFTGKEFKEVYTCDRSMDRIDVYNSENLIVWEEGEDVFATIGGNIAEDEEDNTEDNNTVQTGWVQAGAWYYLDANGIMQTGWLNDRGTWYYLNASGAMQTGWLNDNGTWYYLNASGAMQTGWLNDNGTWYYLNASGAMLSNTTVDGYRLGANGAWIR